MTPGRWEINACGIPLSECLYRKLADRCERMEWLIRRQVFEHYNTGRLPSTALAAMRALFDLLAELDAAKDDPQP